MRAYCKQHAEDGMVNVRSRRCVHDSCARTPYYNVEGRKVAAYCKHHATDGMVNVRDRRCSHDPCNRAPRWGAPKDGVATVCSSHKRDFQDGNFINFAARCRVAGCIRISKWGLHGQQPTHCPQHGPAEAGLVCTLKTPVGGRVRRSPSVGAVSPPPFHVKTECSF